jgi:hypothetical protein
MDEIRETFWGDKYDLLQEWKNPEQKGQGTLVMSLIL